MTFLAPEIPKGSIGDAVRLRQVLVNLIGNALKFTPKGEVSVTGELVRDMGDGVVIHFSVSDTGIGIPLGSAAENFRTLRASRRLDDDGNMVERALGSPSRGKSSR